MHFKISSENKMFDVGFVHVRESQIQGLFKDIQGHVSVYSRTKY
jgi:hypothetical protein